MMSGGELNSRTAFIRYEIPQSLSNRIHQRQDIINEYRMSRNEHGSKGERDLGGNELEAVLLPLILALDEGVHLGVRLLEGAADPRLH